MQESEVDREIELEKTELELRARQYLDMLEVGVKSFGKDIKKTGTTTLIVGGVFLAAFLIGRKIFKSKKPKPFNDPVLNQHGMNQMVVKHPKTESPVARMIKEHIAIFLITLIKERLMDFLNETDKKHEPVQ